MGGPCGGEADRCPLFQGGSIARRRGSVRRRAGGGEFMEALWNELVSFGAAQAGQTPVLLALPAGAMRVESDGGAPARAVVTVTAAHTFTAGARFHLMSGDAQFPPGIKTVTAATPTSFTYLEPARPAPAAPTASTLPTRVHRALVRGVDWEWGYTEMLMSLNHEVRPRTAAIGACNQCHDAAGRLCEVYRGVAARPFGIDLCPP